MAQVDWFLVYLLTGKDSETGEDLTYYGSVRVLKHQMLQDAANWRLDKHLAERKMYLKHLAAKTAAVEVLSHRLEESEALLMEATRTIVHYNEDASIRGGPWCQQHLLRDDISELRSLAHIKYETSWAARMDLVKKFSASAQRTSSLRRHLKGICYTCGEVNWKLCGCRASRMRVISNHSCDAMPSSSSSSTLKATPSIVMKSRSGKRPPMKRIRRVGLDQSKSRSGSRSPKESGCQRAKKLMIPVGSPEWHTFMFGKVYKGTRRKANRKQYVMKKPAARMYKKKVT